MMGATNEEPRMKKHALSLAAARALITHTQLSARDIATEAMRIAGEICIYSNTNIVVEELES